MHILLFIIYSGLCTYGILRIPFIRKSGIRPAILVLLFSLHVLTGLLHNLIAYRYYPEHGDIWNYYQMSFLTRHRLFSDFAQFLADNSTLTHVTHNGIIWIQVILNFFSFDSLTINTLLFSFPVFLGNIALFRLFRQHFPHSSIAACCVFLLPSTLFWTSCIHREGLLYMLLGFLFYSADRLSATRQQQTDINTPRRKQLIIFIFCFLLILYFRFYIIISLIPALALWLLAEKNLPRRRFLTLTCAATLALLLCILCILALPGLFQSFAIAISHRQKEFAGLEGHSRLPLPVMDGTWLSMLKVLPAATRNGLFEPLPGSGGQKIYLAFSMELLLIWCLTLAALIRQLIRPHLSSIHTTPTSTPPKPTTFLLCCVLFALCGMLLTGMMVPFAGAIVRYRSVYLPFLIAPALDLLGNTPILRTLDNRISSLILANPHIR